MGLFDFLFGSSSKSSSNTSGSSSSTQNQSNQGTQTQSQTQTGTNTGSTTTSNTQNTTQAQSGTSASTTSTLDQATINALTSLLNPAVASAADAQAGGAATVNSTGLQQVAQLALKNATGGNASTVDQALAADKAAAELNFQTGEGQQIATTQQAIGSKVNTYSQLIEQKGKSDLATQLDQITANAKLQELGLNNNSLQTVISALTQASNVGATDATAALNPVLQLVAALKGAQTTRAGTTAQTGTTTGDTTQTTIQDLINSLTANSNTSAQGTAVSTVNSLFSQQGSSKGTETPGLIPAITSLF